ncbi:MAG: c-type cytochrome [Acidobacteriia bacterium]|nr:c-type cytochrome [Terriglobia bacterium]
MESWRKKEFLFWAAAAVVALLLFVLVLKYGRELRNRNDRALSTFMAGDPHEGGRVFSDKGCGRCHAIAGVGGSQGGGKARDLAEMPNENLSLNELATAMWNHAPDMWKRMGDEKLEYPRLSETEVTNLFAFLYTIRYVNENGNPDHGAEVFSSKGCIQCHAIQGQGARVGPDLANNPSLQLPFIWAQEMWNHAPRMEELIRQKHLPWPKFEDNEMVDLLSYVQNMNAGVRQGFEVFPADSAHGQEIFREKGCIVCHAVDGEGGKIGPDLGQNQKVPHKVTQLGGWMWNHSPEMWQIMKSKGIERPRFEGREMPDLIAYLYTIHYFDDPGNVQSGDEVYKKKGCAMCHGENGQGGKGGPAIQQLKGKFSVVRMAYTMWQHGPQMYARAQQQNIPWPKFQGNDMANLIAFLNSSKL